MSVALKAGQSPPITPWVIVVCDSVAPYLLGELQRKEVLYHTAKFLKTVKPDTQESRGKHTCYACPDDLAWEKAVELWNAAQDLAFKLANRLRGLGTYSSNLEKAGGFGKAPNPLTKLVLYAQEPDTPFPTSYGKWPNLRAQVHTCLRHTRAMVEVDSPAYQGTQIAPHGYHLTNQVDHFPLADQAEADSITELATRAQTALTELRTHLEETLGTYEAACADGRHSKKETELEMWESRWPDGPILDKVKARLQAESKAPQPEEESQECCTGMAELLQAARKPVEESTEPTEKAEEWGAVEQAAFERLEEVHEERPDAFKTLEELKAKYNCPFKLGDRVQAKDSCAPHFNQILTVMQWVEVSGNFLITSVETRPDGAHWKYFADDLRPAPVEESEPAPAQETSQKQADEIRQMRLDDLRTDAGTQQRASFDPEVAAEYSEVLKAGGDLPPVEVVWDIEGEGEYILVDGFHRLEAYRLAERRSIPCKVTEGSFRDAILASALANQNHGLRRTWEDKRNAVNTLLNDAEWSQWSDRLIASKAGVSHTFVANLRKRIQVATTATPAKEEAPVTAAPPAPPPPPRPPVAAPGSEEPKGKVYHQVEQIDLVDEQTEAPEVDEVESEVVTDCDNLDRLYKPGDRVRVIKPHMATGRTGKVIDYFTKDTSTFLVRVELDDLEGEFLLSEFVLQLYPASPEVKEEPPSPHAESVDFAPGDRIRVLSPNICAGSTGEILGYFSDSKQAVKVDLDAGRVDEVHLFSVTMIEKIAPLSEVEQLETELQVTQTLYHLEQDWRMMAEAERDAAYGKIDDLEAQIHWLRETAEAQEKLLLERTKQLEGAAAHA